VAVCAVNCTVYRRSCCSHSTSHRSIARYSSKIAIISYPTCIRRPRRNIAMAFGTEKLEWCCYLMVKNEDMFIRYDRMHERDRRTDTVRRHIGRAYASRDKNTKSASLTGRINVRSLYTMQAPLNPLMGTSNNMKLILWPLMDGLCLVQRGGDWAGPQRAQSPSLYQM